MMLPPLPRNNNLYLIAFGKIFQIAHQAKYKLTLPVDSYMLLAYTINNTETTQGWF